MQSLTTAIVIKQWGTLAHRAHSSSLPPSIYPAPPLLCSAHYKVGALIRSCSQLLARQTPGVPVPESGRLGQVLRSQSLHSVWTKGQRKMASRCCYYDDVLQ